MNIPRQFTSRKICERYHADWTGKDGYIIWSPYFERAYIPGIATDKMPRERFQTGAFSLAFARLLGQAAASNIIVGRCDAAKKKNTMFDDGDEIITVDADGMPNDIVVADQTGTFADFDKPLADRAATYADPVNRRVEYLGDPEGFARVYLDAFIERFLRIQEKYRLRKKAFDNLFKVRPYKDYGCFAHRWKCVLQRLEQSDPYELAEIIRANLRLSVELQPADPNLESV
jgi:hypothetical protein